MLVRGYAMLSYKEFMEVAHGSPAERNRPKPYLVDHSLRFHKTYAVLRDLIKDKQSILSVGAGRAFVEFALAGEVGAEITVFDFEEAIKRNEDQYSKFHFKRYSGNFVTDFSILSGKIYDFILYCEIVEHIPIDPKEQFTRLTEFLKPGGYLVVSTPNIASLVKCRILLSGSNIIARPDRLFSEVAEINESVHRREYVMHEIGSAMRDANLEVKGEYFIQQKPPRNRPFSLLLYTVTNLVPRWRPMLLLVGKKT